MRPQKRPEAHARSALRYRLRSLPAAIRHSTLQRAKKCAVNVKPGGRGRDPAVRKDNAAVGTTGGSGPTATCVATSPLR